VEPARGLEDLGRRLRLLEIAFGDVGAPDEDLAVGGDLDLDVVERLADRAELEPRRPVEGAGRTGLGQPVAFQDEDARRVEELGDVTRKRRAAGDRPLQPAPERRVQLAEDKLVRDRALEPEDGGQRLAGLRCPDARAESTSPTRRAGLSAQINNQVASLLDRLYEATAGMRPGWRESFRR